MSRALRLCIVVALSVECFAACRPQIVTSNASSLDGEGATCDLETMSNAIATQGIIAALQSDATACLDDESVAAEDASADSTVLAGSPEPDAGDVSGLALAGIPKKADVVVAVGWEVMEDLLNVVAQKSLEGSTNAKADAQGLRKQTGELVSLLNGAIKPYGGQVGVTLYYSFDDLYSLVKVKFIDPAVYGYSGIGHRIVHRRYSRGRGLVYRIATRILAEELTKYDALARQEAARASTSNVRFSFLRADRSLNTSQESFLTLWLDNAVVGRTVAYREAKVIAEQIVNAYKQLAANRP